MSKKIIDVSLPLSPKLISYPLNPKVSVKSIKTKTSFISELSLGSHSGTHIDAPRHVFKSGLSIDKIPPETFIGPCRVLDFTHVTRTITILELIPQKIKKGERILVKTSNSKRGYKKFYSDYVYLDGDGAKFLADQEISLFGIDYLSVKEKGSSDNRPHTELLSKNIPIIEGLDLAQVSPGNYMLYALPLRLEGLDGAPARVFLEPLGKN